MPRQPVVDWGPARPHAQVRLAQMQDFQGDRSVTLDWFSDQVDELSQFYQWVEQETCRQARAHLRGTTLAYVRRAPFPPRTWEELKNSHEALRTQRSNSHLQGAQFRSCC